MRPIKRSFTIKGHKTSISLEPPFWDALKDAAGDLRVPLAQLVAMIDDNRSNEDSGLSTAVRVWLLDYYRGSNPIIEFDGGSRD
jgi:predicted DNA-binding ribbon-helix-helix protein